MTLVLPEHKDRFVCCSKKWRHRKGEVSYQRSSRCKRSRWKLWQCLRAAAGSGRKDIVEMLMKAAADVNAQGGWYGNALRATAFNGYKHGVEILMKAGADVNAQGGDYGNALLAAVLTVQEDVVILLLKSHESSEVE